ncbi:hypothetical protein GCM10023237_21720 [Streptomyces coeruleoprunus]
MRHMIRPAQIRANKRRSGAEKNRHSAAPAAKNRDTSRRPDHPGRRPPDKPRRPPTGRITGRLPEW